MEQEFNQDFGQEQNTGNTTENSVKRVRKNLAEMKDAVTNQAVGLKEKLSEQTRTYGGQIADKLDSARGKTSAKLHTTSERIKSLAMYVEEHNTRDMSEAIIRNSSNIIRKHPGKSLLTGLVLGIILGRGMIMRRRHL